MSGVLILGATSAIARGCAHALAARGHALYLAGRDRDELKRLASDLEVRYGIRVGYGRCDVLAVKQHERFVDAVMEHLGGLQGVVSAVGDLGDPEKDMRDPEAVVRRIQSNFAGVAALLTVCANRLEERGEGFIIGITSVAGDRGRQSNYPYGAAKGGLSLFLQGLRNRLHPSGVRVLTIKPGFVDTAMTYGMPGLFLVADPASVGARIVRALEGRTDVVYVPWFWRYIMLVIRAIPEPLFKRLKL
ncbi:MAG: SDR family oxidoreductase [Gammaproteobacteria bacterium]